MSIDSIVLEKEQTRCYLQVENLNTEGGAWFCADENIQLVELKSNRKRLLLRAENIPVCPESYQFSYPGEKLSFILVFPGLVDPKGEIDIIENCSDNCFSLKGIILDNSLNEEIRSFEQGVLLFNQGDLKGALQIFESLSLSSYVNENHFAYTLYILPVIYYQMKEEARAIQAYERLKSTSILNKDYFIQKLLEIEFFRKMN